MRCCFPCRYDSYFPFLRRDFRERVDDNQEFSLAVRSESYPSFFCLAVHLVEKRNGQRIQENFGSTLEGDLVLSAILFRLVGIPVKSVAQSFFLLPSSSIAGSFSDAWLFVSGGTMFRRH